MCFALDILRPHRRQPGSLIMVCRGDATSSLWNWEGRSCDPHASVCLTLVSCRGMSLPCFNFASWPERQLFRPYGVRSTTFLVETLGADGGITSRSAQCESPDHRPPFRPEGGGGWVCHGMPVTRFCRSGPWRTADRETEMQLPVYRFRYGR